MLTIICVALSSHQRTNSVIEKYNRGFNHLFDSPDTGIFVFSERVRVETVPWEKRQEDALQDSFTNRQERKEVPWSVIPKDFDEWEPKSKRGETGSK